MENKGLIHAMTSNDTRTTNGMSTHSTTSDYCVDMFGQIGSMRKESDERVLNVFTKAFGENPLVAMKLLFWTRDVRGGAGERKIFKTILKHLAEHKTEALGKNVHLIPEYGRWSDIFVLFDTKLEDQALSLIGEALRAENGLCAKWLPRQSKKGSAGHANYTKIRKYLGLNPKAYRKLVVSLSNTVEQLMCAGNWDGIDFSKLPSKAMSDYMKSFSKHTPEKWVSYLESVKKGESKMNASAVYPYDIIKSLKQGNTDGADAQWSSLPNYMEGNAERVLPLVDVSGSMTTPAGGNPNVSAMDVAISLGLYISERNEGFFKDAFLTFTAQPKLEVLKGTLSDRFSQLKRAKWGQNTNISLALSEILNKAVDGNVPQEQMPTMLMIFSDMQFDQATGGGNYWNSLPSKWNLNALELVNKLYSEAGYSVPKVVFWNLSGANDGTPVKSTDNGTALVSGFSPSLLLSLLTGKDISPLSMMMDVVNSNRYSPIT